MLSNYKVVTVLVAILLDIEYQSKFCKIIKKTLCYFCVRSCSIIQQAAGGGAAQMLRIVNLFFFTYIEHINLYCTKYYSSYPDTKMSVKHISNSHIASSSTWIS